MRKTFLSLILVVVATIPRLNAQQTSPGQNTATQQNSKPKARPIRTFPQPGVQPTPGTTANNNPGKKKGIANNPGHGKPADNKPRNGKTSDNNVGRGETNNDNHDNYAEAMRRYRHERHDH